MPHRKIPIRKEMLAKRDALKKEEVAEKSYRIAEKILAHPKFVEAGTIAIYFPIGNEVDTKKVIERALVLGKIVLLPSTNQMSDKITLHRYSKGEELVLGKFGIPEPKNKALRADEPDLVIVPGVCFGLCMHRIGYGKGYYDRFLKLTKAYKIGVCFDIQVVEKLPTHEHDVPMNEIITEKRTIGWK